MDWLAWAVGAAALCLVLDRVLLRMEARGWIYSRKVKPKGASAAILGAAAEAFQPARTVVVEESDRQRRHVAEAAEGQDKDVPPRSDPATLRGDPTS